MSDKSKPIAERKGEPPADAAPSEGAQAEDGKVGPGRPPKQHQWKKGIASPNPKGRPRKKPSMAPDLKQALEDALNSKVTLTKDQKERTLSKAKLGIEQLVNQFAKGDRYARRDLMDYAQRLGVDLLAGSRKHLEEVLAPDHQAILDAYLHRRAGSDIAVDRVIAPPELLDDDVTDSGPPSDEVPNAVQPPKEPQKTAQEIHDERSALRRQGSAPSVPPVINPTTASDPAPNVEAPLTPLAGTSPNASAPEPRQQRAPNPPAAVSAIVPLSGSSAPCAGPSDPTGHARVGQRAVSKLPKAASTHLAAASATPGLASTVEGSPPPPVKPKPWGQMSEREKQEHFLMINKRRDR